MTDKEKPRQEILLEKILAVELTKLFEKKFKTEKERLAFFFTDGTRNAEQIGAFVGISGQQVRNYWKEWKNKKIVKVVKGTKTKCEKVF